MDVCNAFFRAGGTYYKIDDATYHHIIRCLSAGQYYLERADDGSIMQFMMWWFVDSKDIPKARKYEWRPEDITKGDSVFIVDYINHTGRRGMVRMMKELRATKFKGKQGIAWSHRNTEVLKHFPSIKGAPNEMVS